MAKILGDIFPNGLTLADLTPPPPLAPEHQLRAALSDAGLPPPDEIIMDGVLRRFSTNGKPKDASGWYVAFDDGKGPAGGAFGDWRQGLESTWRADIGRELSPVEQMAHAARMRDLKAQREKELAMIRADASENAAALWEGAPLASDEHPYLQRKGISNPGMRVAPDGRLIAPMFADSVITSLQYIDGDGAKRFLKGGKTGGAWWSIGGAMSSKVYICEGVATAASVFEATGKPVAIAFSAGNMTATAQEVRRIAGPLCELVIVADNDESGTGQREAEKAAQAVGARVWMPPVTGDANDYAQAGHDLAGELEPPLNSDNEILRKLDVVFADELGDDYHMPDELVQGLLTVGSASVVYGDSNSGKTFFVLDMCCSIARGEEWMGRKTEGGLVVYLATESPNSIKTRLQAYQRHHGCSVPNFAVVQVPVNFYERNGDLANICKLVELAESKMGAKARIIVGDTLARISAGANENSGEDMGPVMARFDALSKATGAHVLVIHHNGKDQAKGARGWSGIRAHIDTEIELAEVNGQRSATITKQRELPGKMTQIYFDLHVVALGVTKWGDDATSCIVVPVDDEDIAKNQPPKEPKALSAYRKYFEDAVINKGRIDVRINAPFISSDAWNEYTKTTHPGSDGSRKTYLSKAKKALENAGYITPAIGGYAATDHEVFAGAFIGLHKY